MKGIDLNIPYGAIFSGDGKYRYALWRVWSTIKRPLLFVGLNPSKASSTMNDPTIIRLMIRASNAGFGGLLAANLYGYVSSYPDVLLGDGDFVGEENDAYLKLAIEMVSQTVCGWGSFRAVVKRADAVLKMIPEPYCLGVNKDGQPKHPLYISYDTPLRRLVSRVEATNAPLREV